MAKKRNRGTTANRRGIARMAAEPGSDAGCDWNGNNLACGNTWALLRGLGQLRPAFADSGNLKMSDLAFWNKTASGEARRIEAAALAAQLDRMFTQALLAKYEDGFDFATAVEVLTADLTSPEKTLCELSLTVDSAYNFRGEL